MATKASVFIGGTRLEIPDFDAFWALLQRTFPEEHPFMTVTTIDGLRHLVNARSVDRILRYGL